MMNESYYGIKRHKGEEMTEFLFLSEQSFCSHLIRAITDIHIKFFFYRYFLSHSLRNAIYNTCKCTEM